MTTPTASRGRGGPRPGAGARPKNINALGTGARSRKLEPLYRAVGPIGRAVIVNAITRAMDDALAHAPTGPTRAEARARTAARRHAFRRILTCMRDFNLTSVRDVNAGRLALTFMPIWLRTDAAPPQPTIKPATPASTVRLPLAPANEDRAQGGEDSGIDADPPQPTIKPTTPASAFRLPLAPPRGERGQGGEGLAATPASTIASRPGTATPASTVASRSGAATPGGTEIRYPIEVPEPTHTIYLDSAASTPVRAEVLTAMHPYFHGEYANPSGHYASARRAAEALDNAHRDIATVLGALPEEIILTSGGTESINAAIKGVALAQREAGVGAHILTSSVEHHAVLHSALYLERFGFEVELLPVDHTGRVDPRDVAEAVRQDTVLVSVMYANNEVGTVQPIADIARALRARERELGRRVPFHTDAVQAASTLPLNVDALDVDLLSLSGHKFGGPKGTGLLYLRRGTPYLEQMSGGGQERRRRSGTENVPGAVGLALALTLAQAERQNFIARTQPLRARLLAGVQRTLPDAIVNGPTVEADRLPHTLHLTFDGVEGEAIVDALDALGIEASAGAACTSATWEPSHVLIAMDVPLERAIGSLRLTLWPTLTESDIDAVIEALPRAVQAARLAALPAR